MMLGIVELPSLKNIITTDKILTLYNLSKAQWE